MTGPERPFDSQAAAGSDRRDLADFFGILAARFAHERVERALPKPLPVAKPKPTGRTVRDSTRHRRTLIWLSSALASLLLVAAVTSSNLMRNTAVPAEVLGTWRTSVAGYAGRGFTITPSSLVLNADAGGQKVSTHPITEVHVTTQGHETICTIEYLVDGATFELSLRYSEAAPSVIHLSHQSELEWSRVLIGG